MASLESHLNNNVRFYAQIIEVPSAMYVVMDMLEGPILNEWILSSGNVLISERKAAGLVRQMLTAIHFLHRTAGALHRDVKLENFGFATPVRAGDALPTLKLFDLGLVWVLPEKVTEGTAFQLLPLRPCGTTQWVAPETWRGESGAASDVWGVGLIAHILLCKSMPYGLLECRTGRAAVRALQKNELLFSARESWRYRSDLSMQFTADLLAKDPKMRLTTLAAMGHAWINENERANSKEDPMSVLSPKHRDEQGPMLPTPGTHVDNGSGSSPASEASESIDESLDQSFWHSLVHASVGDLPKKISDSMEAS
eukprot:TRINITY_DN29416_c0_g1_i1.p1 TRINITY_DN29416_c0_g1~~TRINITY_DN29416_c0_g1_i1.p1  ORF type:complete len:365 (+),score=46.17 TRINITY_DN29416_c0_g1_i1:164-1096(+)